VRLILVFETNKIRLSEVNNFEQLRLVHNILFYLFIASYIDCSEAKGKRFELCFGCFGKLQK
jgi:hypothetical protein